MADLAAPDSVEAFHARVAELSDEMPRRLRQCADYLAVNADRIAVSTVAELAAGADVPPSAVIRCCKILGFSGFSQMQRLFRDAHAQGWPDYAARLTDLRRQGTDSPGALLAGFVEAGRLSLDGLAETVDDQALETAVARLSGARLIHVIGLRRAFPAASYLAYAFEKLAIPALLHDGVGKLDRREALRPGDAVLAVTFAPYSEETVALARHAATLGVAVVGITDAPASPLAAIDPTALCIAELDFGGFRVLSATLSLAATLAVAVGTARGGPGAGQSGPVGDLSF